MLYNGVGTLQTRSLMPVTTTSESRYVPLKYTIQEVLATDNHTRILQHEFRITEPRKSVHNKRNGSVDIFEDNNGTCPGLNNTAYSTSCTQANCEHSGVHSVEKHTRLEATASEIHYSINSIQVKGQASSSAAPKLVARTTRPSDVRATQSDSVISRRSAVTSYSNRSKLSLPSTRPRRPMQELIHNTQNTAAIDVDGATTGKENVAPSHNGDITKPRAARTHYGKAIGQRSKWNDKNNKPLNKTHPTSATARPLSSDELTLHTERSALTCVAKQPQEPYTSSTAALKKHSITAMIEDREGLSKGIVQRVDSGQRYHSVMNRPNRNRLPGRGNVQLYARDINVPTLCSNLKKSCIDELVAFEKVPVHRRRSAGQFIPIDIRNFDHNYSKLIKSIVSDNLDFRMLAFILICVLARCMNELDYRKSLDQSHNHITSLTLTT